MSLSLTEKVTPNSVIYLDDIWESISEEIPNKGTMQTHQAPPSTDAWSQYSKQPGRLTAPTLPPEVKPIDRQAVSHPHLVGLRADASQTSDLLVKLGFPIEDAKEAALQHGSNMQEAIKACLSKREGK